MEDGVLCSLRDVGQLSLRAWTSSEGDDVCAFLGGEKDGSDFPETHRGFPGVADRKHPCYRFSFFFFYGGEETLECDNPSSVAHGCGFSNYIVVLKNISFFPEG